MANKVLEETGQRCQPAADCSGSGAVDLAHNALPGNHGPVVHLSKLDIALDAERLHEVLHVELVSTAGAFAFLLREPDLLLGNLRKRIDLRQLASRINYLLEVSATSHVCAVLVLGYPRRSQHTIPR